MRFVVGRAELGLVLIPLPVIIPPALHTHLSSGAGTVDPLKATVPRDSVSPRSATNSKIDMEPIRDVDGTENNIVFTKHMQFDKGT
jgi:hypothetical protein